VILADLIIHSRVSGYNSQQPWTRSRRDNCSPELSIAKLAGTMNMRRLGDFVSCGGTKLVADGGSGAHTWSMLVLGTPGGRIAGGSDEVMRSIVGERVLGLPKGPASIQSPFRS
jgi:acyl-CoA dehydrogenase